MPLRPGALFLAALWVGALIAAGCAHLPKYALPGPGASPTPTPSIGPSISPAPCGTQAPATTVIVAMSSSITATSAPPYGTINGYTKVNPDGTFGNVASVISARSTDIAQFVNADFAGPSVIVHSAVGFPGATSFPPTPYSFPASTQQPIGSAISQTLWSTGRRDPTPCFSQTLSVSPGTFYFGDYDFYNTSNMRDVIVVSP